ncbi:unnamed protein product [Meloidogyne enterolobii]|uniref:Uncharacterized protein n=1 Tax=Meloidogyne enterolobii TaxID=390850 RepID=A0ACB0Y5W0_MELEN
MAGGSTNGGGFASSVCLPLCTGSLLDYLWWTWWWISLLYM